MSLEVMLRGTCDRARLLDLVENFTLFSEHKAGLVKIIGQNHQFLGVNNAIALMLYAPDRLKALAAFGEYRPALKRRFSYSFARIVVLTRRGIRSKGCVTGAYFQCRHAST